MPGPDIPDPVDLAAPPAVRDQAFADIVSRNGVSVDG
jgi:hypothetical protein